MIEAGTSKPPAFDVVVVHSFSRFFRDEFEMEYYYRKLAKNGVKLVSITHKMQLTSSGRQLRCPGGDSLRPGGQLPSCPGQLRSPASGRGSAVGPGHRASRPVHRTLRPRGQAGLHARQPAGH